MLFLGACHPTASNTSGLFIEKKEGFSAEDSCFVKGVSALYAEILDGQLIMAGGCNFPHIPMSDGGKEVFNPSVGMVSVQSQVVEV